jgi:hypothetical protein
MWEEPQDKLPPATAFLNYDPKLYNPYNDKRNESCDTYLDMLGIKNVHVRDPPMKKIRDEIQQDIGAFLWCPLMQYLRSKDNESAFKVLVQAFLEEFGPVWWGEASRVHLVEEDPSEGFLYPRDAEREDSM